MDYIEHTTYLSMSTDFEAFLQLASLLLASLCRRVIT